MRRHAEGCHLGAAVGEGLAQLTLDLLGDWARGGVVVEAGPAGGVLKLELQAHMNNGQE